MKSCVICCLYLKVGYYTEIAFPETDVRFIAINNGVDSASQTESDFTPFLNIMKEFYAKESVPYSRQRARLESRSARIRLTAI